MTNKIIYSLEQELTFSIKEHQVLILFNTDDDALKFEEWLQIHGGFESFEKFCNRDEVNDETTTT